MRLISRLSATAKQIKTSTKLVVVILIVFVLAGSVWFTNEQAAKRQQSATDADTSLIARSVTVEDHTIGPITAPVQVIVYSDFECKYCKRLFGTDIPRLQAQFGDQVVVAFRHFTLKSQPGTQAEAEAAECVYLANGNESFWLYASMLFDRNVHGNIETLGDMAQSVGVDRKIFTQCMQNGGGKARVEKDRIEASVAGINTTPSEIIKSTHRALVVKGDYYSQISASVGYLLETNKQIEDRKK